MSIRLSVILHCYNNQAALVKQANIFQSWGNPPGVEVIFIDDGSSPPLDVSVFPNWVKPFRILDDIPWNQPGAKNLGASQASGDWLFFYDADVFLDIKNLAQLVAYLPGLQPSVLYRFARIWVQHEKEIDSHTNCQIVHRLTYLCGGVTYDEDMSGSYGYDDTLFEKAWLFSGRNIQVLSGITLRHDTDMPTTVLSRDTSINGRKLQLKLNYLWVHKLTSQFSGFSRRILALATKLGWALPPSSKRVGFRWERSD